MKPISYIVENDRDEQWGLAIKCVGYEKINKGDKYPTDRHLAAYNFSPDTGRTLQEYQIVYITEGEGVFQSASAPETRIQAGTMFLLVGANGTPIVPTSPTMSGCTRSRRRPVLKR